MYFNIWKILRSARLLSAGFNHNLDLPLSKSKSLKIAVKKTNQKKPPPNNPNQAHLKTQNKIQSFFLISTHNDGVCAVKHSSLNDRVEHNSCSFHNQANWMCLSN